MYEVGKYKYKTKESYQSLLFIVIGIFILLLIGLYNLKENANTIVYYATFIIGISTIIHLVLRYFHSIKLINYIWNEY